MLIDDVQHAALPPVVRAVLHEVVRPHVVLPLRSEADAGSVVQPESTSLRLFGWHREPLAPPDALDPLGVHRPTVGPKKGGDATVAVAAVLTRLLGHGFG